MAIKITSSILKQVYKSRPKSAKKYDYGLVLVIGGSELYSGAPALSAMAAFRAGVDMVRILAPKRAADIIASFSPNLAAYPLTGKWLNESHLSTLLEFTKAAQVSAKDKVSVIIGGGLGRSEETQEVVKNYLAQINIPVVIDADAIYAVAEKPEVLKNKPFLCTPHSYEFYILTGHHPGKSDKERIKIVQRESLRLKTTILLKGQNDIISNGKKVAINKTGSPFMTVGGTGDVLAGICGALLARGINPFLAAQVGAFISGKAGQLAAKQKKDGLVATDVIEMISEVIR